MDIFTSICIQITVIVRSTFFCLQNLSHYVFSMNGQEPKAAHIFNQIY